MTLINYKESLASEGWRMQLSSNGCSGATDLQFLFKSHNNLMFEACKACSHPTPSELHLIHIHTNKWSSSHAFDICRFTHQPDSLLWVVGFNAECQLCSMFGTLFVTYPDLFPSAAHSQPPPPHRMFPPAAASLHVNCGIVWERPASQGTARLAFRGRGGISEALRSEEYLECCLSSSPFALCPSIHFRNLSHISTQGPKEIILFSYTPES